MVIAGVPTLKPDGNKADLSPGTVFLLAAMLALSNTASTLAPSMFLDLKSTKIKWVSVPPETKVKPLDCNSLAKLAALATTSFWYSLNSG